MLVAAEDVEDSLKSDLIVLLDFLNLGAGRGQNWVNEATFKECNIDAPACHKVDEILVGDLEFALVGQSYVFDDSLSVCSSQDNAQLRKVLLDSTLGDVLSGHHKRIGEILVLALTVGL